MKGYRKALWLALLLMAVSMSMLTGSTEADPAVIIGPEGSGDPAAEDVPVVEDIPVVTEEWVDQTPIDSWWTGDDEDTPTVRDAEWVDPW